MSALLLLSALSLSPLPAGAQAPAEKPENKSVLFDRCVACVNALVQGPCYVRVATMAGWGLCLSCTPDGGVKEEDRFIERKRCPDCSKVSWSLADFNPAPDQCVPTCSPASDPARRGRRPSDALPAGDCARYQPALDGCSRDKQACGLAKAQGLDAADCEAQYQACAAGVKKRFAACQPSAVLAIQPEAVHIGPLQQTDIIDVDAFNAAVNALGASGAVDVLIRNQSGKIVTLHVGVATGLDGVRRYTADGVHYYQKIAELTNPSLKQRRRHWLDGMKESLWATAFRPAQERTLADFVAENALQDLDSKPKDKTLKEKLAQRIKAKLEKGVKDSLLSGAGGKAVDAGGFAVDSITTMFTEISSQRFRQAFKAYARLRGGGRSPDSIYGDGQDPLGEQIVLLRIGDDNPLSDKRVLLTVLESTYQRYELARKEFGRTE